MRFSLTIIPYMVKKMQNRMPANAYKLEERFVTLPEFAGFAGIFSLSITFVQ